MINSWPVDTSPNMKCWRNIIFTFIFITIEFTATESNRRWLHQRRYGGDGYFETEISNWRWHEEGYLVSNWRRKCSNSSIANSVKSFIAGGVVAGMDKFPFLVGLLMYDPPRMYQCGGSLISPKYVLTAAHCLFRSTAGRVYVGSYTYASAASSEYIYNVSRSNFIINERYDGQHGFQDDIALIKLNEPVTLSSRVNVINLAPSFITQQYLQDEIVTAAGWGRIADNITEFNTQLYYVATPVISFEKCMCFYLPGLVNRRKHLCADGTGGRGGCDGDSGGPLIYRYKSQDYLVGVTSFGSAGGCEIGHPTVYTKVTNYLNWVSKKTGITVDSF